MNFDLPALCFAALFDFNLEPHMIAIIIPIAGLIFGGAVAISAMYFNNRQRQMWHETARLALEKGQPMPLPDSRPERSRGPGGDLRAGLILIGTGAGLYFLLGPGIAAIVGFIGIALFIYAVLVLIFTRKKSPEHPASPL